MAKMDISKETLKVGNALASVRIDDMILNLAKGIAWGQYELDKVGVDITKMMGVPGTVSIGGEKLSMLEAGFIPSFYHFVDTILEIKMEVHIRQEENTSASSKTSDKDSTQKSTSKKLGGKASATNFFASAEVSAKANWGKKSTSAYSKTVDASHSQKFSQDLSASSLMRTKIVPVPPPEVLVERIKILLEKMREEAAEEDDAQVLFKLDGDLAGKFDLPDPAAIAAAFAGSVKKITLTDIAVTLIAAGKWSLKGKIDAKDASYFVETAGDQLKVYQGNEEDKQSSHELLMDKVGQKLLETDDE